MKKSKGATNKSPKSNNPPPPSEEAYFIGDSLPGKELEKAAGHLATDAGKSAIRGVARTFGAITAEWFAKKAAQAHATRLAIKTDAEIQRMRALTDARRDLELTEVQHQVVLERAKRALDRTLYELSYQQENLETIGARSIELLESESDVEPREFDQDWLFRFAEFAQRASDAQIRELWARILASAANANAIRLSPSALFLMSTLDKESAVHFEQFFNTFSSLGICPALILDGAVTRKTKSIKIDYLQELGLLHETRTLNWASGFDIPNLKVRVMSDKNDEGSQATPRTTEVSSDVSTLLCFAPSERGRQIGAAAFERKVLDFDTTVNYLNLILEAGIEKYKRLLIYPLGNTEGIKILITSPRPQEPLLSIGELIRVYGLHGAQAALRSTPYRQVKSERSLESVLRDSFGLPVQATVAQLEKKYGVVVIGSQELKMQH